MVGLGNVDNTSDTNKPISTATQTALNLKADSSTVSAHITNTSNPHQTTAAQLGVYTTSQTDTLLNAKASLASPTFTGNVLPSVNAAYDLGSSTLAWRNIYTNDLHLSNEGHEEGNSVDGTKGNWTIQEGAEHLYIINNKTGKKYKFSLEEIQ